MYVIALLVLLVFYANGKRDLLHALLTAPLLFVSLFYLLSLLRIPFLYSLPLDVLSMLAVGVALLVLVRRPLRTVRVSPVDAAFLGFLALVVVVVVKAYWNTFLLPAIDPVTVPTCAKLVFDAHTIPSTLRPVAENRFVYPPGAPVLLSTLGTVGGPLTVLAVYKYANLLVVACTPFVWALYLDRIFGLRDTTSRLFASALFVAGFFLFDGTLTLALPVAGKNAQLLSALTLPVVLHSLLNATDSLPQKVVATLSILGATLIHYSFPYALLLFGAGYLPLLMGRTSMRQLARLTLIPAFAFLLFAPHFWSLRASNFALPSTYCSPGDSLSCVWRELTSARSHFFFVYHDRNMETVWPFKGLVLCGLFAVAVLTNQVRRRVAKGGFRSHETRSALGAAAAFIGIMAALVLGCETIPWAGVNYDYARWFVYTFSVLLFVLALRSLLTSRWLQYTLICAVPLASAFAPSLKEAQRLIDAATISHAQVADLTRAFGPLSGSRPCQLVTESKETLTPDITLQRHKPLEYAYVLSGCVIVNGTTISRPAAHSRDIDGLPGPEFYEGLDPRTKLYFVGDADFFGTYLEHLGSNPYLQVGRTGWNLSIFLYTPATATLQPASWPEHDIPASLFGNRRFSRGSTVPDSVDCRTPCGP